MVCWLVSLSVDWEVRKSSLDLSHLWVFSKGFFSGQTFTQGLKIIERYKLDVQEATTLSSLLWKLGRGAC